MSDFLSTPSVSVSSASDTLLSLARELVEVARLRARYETDENDGPYPDLAARFRAVLRLHCDPIVTHTLEELKSMPPGARPPDGVRVRIYSSEHGAYWRANGAGYTTERSEAGVYTFGDAWKRSSHCDSSKRISYEILP